MADSQQNDEIMLDETYDTVHEDGLPAPPDNSEIPTTGNWYAAGVFPDNAPGDEECKWNPERKVYGVSPCFGRVFTIEPDPLLEPAEAPLRQPGGLLPRLSVDPRHDESGFVLFEIYWDSLGSWKYLYLAVDLERTTDKFLRWYIYWATNQKPENQIIETDLDGAHGWFPNNGTLLSRIQPESVWWKLHLHAPWPDYTWSKVTVCYYRSFMRADGRLVDRSTDLRFWIASVETAQIRDLEKVLVDRLRLVYQSFYLVMTRNHNSPADADIPRPHHFLAEATDDKMVCNYTLWDRNTPAAQRESLQRGEGPLQEPYRNWGWDEPINVRTPVKLVIPAMCGHTFDWTLQMRVRNVPELEDMVREYFPAIPKDDDVIRFSIFADPNDKGHPHIDPPNERALGLSLLQAYPDEEWNAETASKPKTLYAHLDLADLDYVDLYITYHTCEPSVEEGPLHEFVIVQCPLALFRYQRRPRRTEPDVFIPPVPRFRELCLRKLFEKHGIRPNKPAYTEFTLRQGHQGSFPEDNLFLTELWFQWCPKNEPIEIHMWNASDDMIDHINSYIEEHTFTSVFDPETNSWRTEANNQRYYDIYADRSAGIHPPAIAEEQAERREVQRMLLDEPLVFVEPTALRGGALDEGFDAFDDESGDESNLAAFDADDGVEGFDLSSDEFKRWVDSGPGCSNEPSNDSGVAK